jgi:Protein of unknown function (DUF3179)
MSLELGKSSRRQILKGAAVVGGVGVLTAVGGTAAWRWAAGGGAASNAVRAPSPADSLDALAAVVTSGGPPKDGIPPIDQPRFVGAEEAAFLADDDPVFGLSYHGEIRAYPQLVLVWHEIVNDAVGARPLSVTYCPLTGTVIGLTGVTDGTELTFGTTGNLVNSNLLMYDRQTDSEWPQLLGTAIRGPLKGQRLATVPLVWASWKAWRATHPDTRVLSTETGVLRSYGTDPYGSYRPRSGYYAEGDPVFPVLATDDRFRPKDVVIGLRAGHAAVAVHREHVRRARSVPVTVGDVDCVVIWDDQLDTARVSDSAGPIDALDAMWFAWYAFHPDTAVLP